jgi:hypothetical protein
VKKVLHYSFVLAICLFAGCKKESQKSKTYLLTREITDNREGGGRLDTTNFSYDDHNRIITISDGVGSGKANYTIAYDDQNRVTTAKKLDKNYNLIVQYDFFYGDAVGYYFYGPTHVRDTATLVFNSKHEVIRLDTKHSGYETYDYDNLGNIVLAQPYDNKGNNNLSDDDEYQYDNKKNPLSQTPAANYYLMFVYYIYTPTTLLNNVNDQNGYKYTYTYNADGFPTSASINYFYYKTYITYQYQVK